MTRSHSDGDFLLGVDGGGTKTVALIADEAGLILGAGRAGDPAVLSSDTEAVVSFVGQAVNQALPTVATLTDRRLQHSWARRYGLGRGCRTPGTHPRTALRRWRFR